MPESLAKRFKGILPPGAGLVLIVFEEQLVLARHTSQHYKVLNTSQFSLEDTEASPRQLQSLFHTSGYLGQPVHLVIADSRLGTAYIRRTPDLASASVYETARHLRHDAVDLHIGFIRHTNQQILAIQRFHRDYLQTVFQLLQDLKIPLLSTITLPVLELHTDARLCEESGIQTITLPGGKALITTWQQNALVHAIEATNNDVAATVARFARHYLDTELETEPQIWDRTATGSKHRVTLPKLTQEPKELFKRVPSSKAALALRVVWNSLFAVASLLAMVASVLFTMALVSWLTLDNGQEDVSRYQALYQDRQRLRAIADSLKSVLTESKTNTNQVPAAAVLSAFCQTARSDLYLTSITIAEQSPNETARIVTATGNAQSDNAIFAYFEATRSHLLPHELVIDLLTPQIVASAGRPDTVVQFRLQARVHQ